MIDVGNNSLCVYYKIYNKNNDHYIKLPFDSITKYNDEAYILYNLIEAKRIVNYYNKKEHGWSVYRYTDKMVDGEKIYG